MARIPSLAITSILAAAMAALGTGPASAQGLEGFRTPSGNIHCLAFGPMDGDPPGIRCDVRESTARTPPQPADCEEDWGDSFGLSPAGRGHRLCHGDTVVNERNPVLGYGRAWSRYGITCVSRTDGLTCRNRAGHGFSISRATQTVF